MTNWFANRTFFFTLSCEPCKKAEMALIPTFDSFYMTAYRI